MSESPGVVALPELFHHKWCPALLVSLLQAEGATLAALVERIGGSRGATTQGLHALVLAGWALHHGGHTHPLHPEYTLSPRGKELARAVENLLRAVEGCPDPNFVRRKWPVPILGTLGNDGYPYSSIRQRIPEITDRALSFGLRELELQHLVKRKIDPALPRRLKYVTTHSGKRIRGHVLATAAVLAR